MHLTIDGIEYRVYWNHDREDKVTVCFIRSITPDNKVHIHSGIGIQNGKPFCYNKGRKLSLAKAVHKIFPRKTVEGYVARQQVWERYWEMRGSKW